MAKTFYERRKGPLAENEDWYYLETAEDGAQYVRHEWSYVAIRDLAPNAGEKRYTIEEFFADCNDHQAKLALQERIAGGEVGNG